MAFAMGGDTDGTIEALRIMWGERNAPKRSYLTADRTQLISTLGALHKDIMTALGDEEASEFALKDYAEVLLDCWAGEDGKEMEWLIRGVGATKGAAHYNVPRPTEAPEPPAR